MYVAMLLIFRAVCDCWDISWVSWISGRKRLNGMLCKRKRNPPIRYLDLLTPSKEYSKQDCRHHDGGKPEVAIKKGITKRLEKKNARTQKFKAEPHIKSSNMK